MKTEYPALAPQPPTEQYTPSLAKCPTGQQFDAVLTLDDIAESLAYDAQQSSAVVCFASSSRRYTRVLAVRQVAAAVYYDFHVPGFENYWAGGLWHHNCGKSLTAKAIATAWGVPLLRLDLGALKSKFVGDSEANIRKAFRVVEAIGRCVVWLDEIEKGLAGATSGGSDSGVSADALGAILQWMQERSGEAFVVATANDASSLPPELLRKGRFDEVWWIDLPNFDERQAILKAALKAQKSNVTVDLRKVATACEAFTGSEIAALVPEAMFIAFADNKRKVTTEDLLKVASTTVPLSKTAAEKIERLRNWAAGRARPASKDDQVAIIQNALRSSERCIDL